MPGKAKYLAEGYHSIFLRTDLLLPIVRPFLDAPTPAARR